MIKRNLKNPEDAERRSESTYLWVQFLILTKEINVERFLVKAQFCVKYLRNRDRYMARKQGDVIRNVFYMLH